MMSLGTITLRVLGAPGSPRQCLCSVQADRPCSLKRKCLDWDCWGRSRQSQERTFWLRNDVHLPKLPVTSYLHVCDPGFHVIRTSWETCDFAGRWDPMPPWYAQLCIRERPSSPKWGVQWSLGWAGWGQRRGWGIMGDQIKPCYQSFPKVRILSDKKIIIMSTQYNTMQASWRIRDMSRYNIGWRKENKMKSRVPSQSWEVHRNSCLLYVVKPSDA